MFQYLYFSKLPCHFSFSCSFQAYIDQVDHHHSIHLSLYLTNLKYKDYHPPHPHRKPFPLKNLHLTLKVQNDLFYSFLGHLNLVILNKNKICQNKKKFNIFIINIIFFTIIKIHLSYLTKIFFNYILLYNLYYIYNFFNLIF